MFQKLLFYFSLLLFTSVLQGQTTYFFEDFNTPSGMPPIGWTEEIVSGTDEQHWRTDNPGERDFPAPFDEGFLIFDAAYYVADEITEEVWLETPEITLEPDAAVYVQFDLQFIHHNFVDFIQLELYNGTVWQTVFEAHTQTSILFTNDDTATVYTFRRSLNYLLDNSTSMKLRFRFVGDGGAWWAIDNLLVWTPPPIDVAVAAVLPPVTTNCFGTMEEVKIFVQNIGSEDINLSTYNLRLILTMSGASSQIYTSDFTWGTIDRLAFEPYTLLVDVSVPGTYTLEVEADLLGVPDFDYNIKTATLQNLWFTEPPIPTLDFDEFTLETLDLFWKTEKGNDEPAPIVLGGSNWAKRYFVNDIFHPNRHGLGINFWYGQANSHDWLVGPKIAATENTILTYDLALTDFSISSPTNFGEDDFLKIMASFDCGETYISLRTYDHTTPISHTGQTDTVFLGDYADMDMLVGFYAATGDVPGPEDIDIFLDNIAITQLSPIELGITGFETDFSLNCATEVEELVVTLENFGTTTIDFSLHNALLFLNIDGPDTQNFETLITTGILAPGETRTAAISLTDLTPLAYGCYDATVFLELEEDGNFYNDILQVTEEVIPPVELPTPLIDFTGYNNSNLVAIAPGWEKARGELGSLEWGAGFWLSDAFANKTSHDNGTSARVTIFNNFIRQWIVSPRISVLPHARFTYDIALTSGGDFEQGVLGSDDRIELGIYSDCGATFEPMRIYDNSSEISFNGQNDTLDLSAYMGEEIRIAFYITSGTIDDEVSSDVFLDNLLIDTPFQNDIGISSGHPDAAVLCRHPEMPLLVEVTNFGIETQSNFDIVVEIADGYFNEPFTSFTYTFTEALALGESAVVEVGTLNTTTLSVLYFDMHIVLATDENVMNNEVSWTLPFPVSSFYFLTDDAYAAPLELSAWQFPSPTDYNYLWSTGETTPTITISESGTYWVQVSSENCLFTDTNTITIQSPIGIQNTTQTNNIYPNPTSGQLYIESNDLGKQKLSLFNINGQLVATKNSEQTNTEWDISVFPKGIYILKIENSQGVFYEKIVKQ